MDYDNYTYIAITLSEHSRYFYNPSSITSTHPSLNYCGRVGEFSDVHRFSVPKDVWSRDGSALMSQLIGSDGVLHVDVEVLRTRSKRHMEELWRIRMTPNPFLILLLVMSIFVLFREWCVLIKSTFISDGDLVLWACSLLSQAVGDDIPRGYYKLWPGGGKWISSAHDQSSKGSNAAVSVYLILVWM